MVRGPGADRKPALAREDGQDRGHGDGPVVVRSAFLAAGGAASTVVTLTSIGSQSEGASAAAIGIGVVGLVFALSMLVAAAYLWRQR